MGVGVRHNVTPGAGTDEYFMGINECTWAVVYSILRYFNTGFITGAT